MGNFKPLTTCAKERKSNSRRRSILSGSVGKDGDNLPSDLRLIACALTEAGLLTADASHEDTKHAISRAIRHVQRTNDVAKPRTEDTAKLTPASDTEIAMRRALAEFRFPTAHRTVALTASLKGARAILDTGMLIAKKRLHEFPQTNDTPPAFRRALLPNLSPDSYQSNRRLAETMSHTHIDGIEVLISESIKRHGKAGFVEVRDFLDVLRTSEPDRVKNLEEKIKRHLQGKPRRRFIKLMQCIPPNEDDFVDGAS